LTHRDSPGLGWTHLDDCFNGSLSGTRKPVCGRSYAFATVPLVPAAYAFVPVRTRSAVPFGTREPRRAPNPALKGWLFSAFPPRKPLGWNWNFLFIESYRPFAAPPIACKHVQLSGGKRKRKSRGCAIRLGVICGRMAPSIRAAFDDPRALISSAVAVLHVSVAHVTKNE
jgi:hypothetical protein